MHESWPTEVKDYVSDWMFVLGLSEEASLDV